MGLRRAAAILFVLMTMVLTAVHAPGSAQAAITTPFTVRFDVNTNGSILLRGNSNLTCPTAAANCSQARAGTAVAYEGDRGTVGDSLLVDGQPLTDAANPASNFFNSSATDGGVPYAGRDPPYDNRADLTRERRAAAAPRQRTRLVRLGHTHLAKDAPAQAWTDQRGRG